METETVESNRQIEQLLQLLKRRRIPLENFASNSSEIYFSSAEDICKTFDNDFSQIVEFLQLKLEWPLRFKRQLIERIRDQLPDQQTKFSSFANFVFNPTKNLKKEIIKPSRQLRSFFPFIASVERQYGSAVGSLFYLQYVFFIMNFVTLLIWLAAVTIPYKIFESSNSADDSFNFGTIFTAKGYLAASVLFQGSYRRNDESSRYNVSLIYLLACYVYFFVWFLFLTIRYGLAYKRKVLKSILNKNSGTTFLTTFARSDYTIRSKNRLDQHRSLINRQYRDFIDDDERIRSIDVKQFRQKRYLWKMIITAAFHIVLALALGGANWLILHFCADATIDCTGSLIFMVLINRLVPYTIVALSQIEELKYLSYKLDAAAYRCVLLNMSTVLSHTIYFFLHRSSCYETAYGQFVYMLLLSDAFASLVFPFVFGLLFDFFGEKIHRDYDGVNIHVQLSPPILLYSQFLIWLGIYFSPLISILILLNLFFSSLSHRLYLFIRSKRKGSSDSVYIWNSQRLEYIIYLLGYILLIIAVTAFIVFTTQISPSETCGPFSKFNASYAVIDVYLEGYRQSALWISLMNFVTSPGLTYFLGVIFFVIVYKYRKEGLAEKQLVFIRENNLESKKKLRKKVIKRLHQQASKQPKRKVIETPATRQNRHHDEENLVVEDVLGNTEF